VKLISDDRPEKGTGNEGTRFFTLIKAEVIRGYYTSKAGLEELNFRGNAFYPVPPGCSGSADHPMVVTAVDSESSAGENVVGLASSVFRPCTRFLRP
jgi:hypothetical protein